MQTAPTAEHAISRVRRETRKRRLTVSAVERITPQMQRIMFESPDLRDFDSQSPDDHIKLFFSAATGSDQTCMRDYTPRSFDARAGTLTVDFALHEAGPATAWALSAQTGDQLEIGGPRGSTIVADDFDWYLLIGDETALPAIGRRVEELRAGVAVTTIVIVDDEGERQAFETKARWSPIWVSRFGRTGNDAAILLEALAGHATPPGDGYIWIAAEALVARSLRHNILEIRRHPPAWVKSSGYWVRGEPGAHE